MSRSRKGFTLIELLIVVVIIGILASVAIPKFAETKEKAYIAAMKSDLRRIATQAEGFYADNSTYASAVTSTNFTPSSGVKFTSFTGTTTGWQATVGSDNTNHWTCTIYAGTQAPSGKTEGTPYCSNT